MRSGTYVGQKGLCHKCTFWATSNTKPAVQYRFFASYNYITHMNLHVCPLSIYNLVI